MLSRQLLAQRRGAGAGSMLTCRRQTLLHATLARVAVRGAQHAQLFMPPWRPQGGISSIGVSRELAQSGSKMFNISAGASCMKPLFHDQGPHASGSSPARD